MALNFRLSYNTGYDYTDLLPYTEMKNIQGVDDILKYSTLDVVIPAFDGMTQEIVVDLSEKQKVAPFSVDLIDTGLQALRDYDTLDQIETIETGLKITRLGVMPKSDINVRLTFWERGL